MKNLYDVLGIRKTASASEIKFAFRRLAKKHHPDAGGDPESFRMVRLAYAILSNETKRLTYDETGEINETSPRSQVFENALTDISTIFAQIIDENKGNTIYVDVVGTAIMRIRSHKKTSEIERRDCQKIKAVIKKLQGRMKAKGEINLFEILISERLQNANNIIKQCDFKIEVAEKALELLDDYTFEKEERDLSGRSGNYRQFAVRNPSSANSSY